MKARTSAQVKIFLDIPNVGVKCAEDFALLKINKPEELKGKNAYKLYDQLCLKTGTRQDPCVLDTFLAVIDFMNGAPARPWWYYTKQRKHKLRPGK